MCGQGVVAAGGHAGRFRDLDLDLIPATGLLPAVVPGAFDAWCLLLRDWGTWELPDILAFAIGYARNGVHIVPRISATIEGVRPLFEQAWRSSAAVFLPGGNVPRPGSLFARPALADTYERVCREAVGGTREARIDAARRAWYQGFVAEAVDRFCRDTDVLDVTGRHHRGLLRGDDFARWSATVEAPLTYDYRGHTVLKCGPWSQGPAFLQQLALLRGLRSSLRWTRTGPISFTPWWNAPSSPSPTARPTTAILTSCASRWKSLLSDAYNSQRRGLVAPDASLELRPGSIPGYAAMVDHQAAARADMLSGATAGTGEPTVARLGVIGADTCHLDVIDRHGNMVSATPSGGWLQSSPVVPGLGFCLGTRGQMFWLRPDLPNSLAPGKRPRTTLSPSFALRDGKPWMAFGTPGGEQQDQWSLIFLLRMVHYNMGIQEAIDAPSFHTEHWPSSFWPRVARPGKVVIEGRYPDAVLTSLRARGHKAEKGEDWSEGRLSAARREPDGQMFAGANPRGMQGYAVGR